MTKKLATTPHSVLKMAFVVLIGLFFMFGGVLGETIIDENFDTYNFGDLVGQGGWVSYFGGVSQSPQVVSLGYFGQGVLIPAFYNGAYKVGETLVEGILQFYFRIVQTETEESWVDFSIQDSANLGVYVAFTCVEYNCSNGVRVMVMEGQEFTEIAVVSQGVFHSVKVSWDTDIDEAKYQVDNENWTGWLAYAGTTNGLDRVALINAGTITTMGAWFDEIGETGVYEPPPLPSCSGLSGVELWLCNMKNDIGSIFLPSNQKISELRETIDEIKQKFPLNYLSGASDFFSSVRTNINSSSDIHFKILGKEGTVNFAFWENTAEIGGSVQTIGEIVGVFITFLIILGFVFWAISFGKRVF
jgi:hypothetical protein